MNKTERPVGLVIPTLNAGGQWPLALKAIAQQSLLLQRRVIVDSESSDATVQLAISQGFEVISIKKSDFNHGGTRQSAADLLSDCELVVFMTQDAILASSDALADIVRCLDDVSVAVAYGRQLPHVSATAIEAHARAFNYGSRSVRKDAAAAMRLGAKVFFCSNSFAAYNLSILSKLGGFRHDLILGEDMDFAARAVHAGYANVYCAKATAYHSHDYSFFQTVTRYFDIGVFDAHSTWLKDRFGSHRGEGLRFVKSELRYLWANDRMSIPSAALTTVAKLIGYRLGRLERQLPLEIKRKLSMMPTYWR